MDWGTWRYPGRRFYVSTSHVRYSCALVGGVVYVWYCMVLGPTSLYVGSWNFETRLNFEVDRIAEVWLMKLKGQGIDSECT